MQTQGAHGFPGLCALNPRLRLIIPGPKRIQPQTTEVGMSCHTNTDSCRERCMFDPSLTRVSAPQPDATRVSAPQPDATGVS